MGNIYFGYFQHVSFDCSTTLEVTLLTFFFSSVLHAITAAFHVAKDHRRTKREDHIVKEDVQHHNGRDGFVDGNAPGYTGGRQDRV